MCLCGKIEQFSLILIIKFNTFQKGSHENWSAMSYIHIYSAYMYMEWVLYSHVLHIYNYRARILCTAASQTHTHTQITLLDRANFSFDVCTRARTRRWVVRIFVLHCECLRICGRRRRREPVHNDCGPYIFIVYMYIYIYVYSDIQHKDPGTKAHATHPLVNHNNSCTCWHISHIYTHIPIRI